MSGSDWAAGTCSVTTIRGAGPAAGDMAARIPRPDGAGDGRGAGRAEAGLAAALADGLGESSMSVVVGRAA